LDSQLTAQQLFC